MTTLLYSHKACEGHDPGPMHPESPARLRAILSALDDDAFSALERRESPKAALDQIARVHPRHVVDLILQAIPESGYVGFDADTIVSPGSGEAALRAAGAVCAAVDAVMTGAAKNAFCAGRPPGHHAEPSRPMGFCLFNNIAVGVEQARAVHGLERVAVMDFDVHHGNGTQAAFWDDPKLLYTSTHQMPLFPGTGSARERGASGNIINVPLAPMSGSAAFRAAMTGMILPAIAAFAPEFLFISAGFDAHEDDPLANLRFQTEDYEWATRELVGLAESACQGRLVSTLEGGYNLQALAASCAGHVHALMAA